MQLFSLNCNRVLIKWNYYILTLIIFRVRSRNSLTILIRGIRNETCSRTSITRLSRLLKPCASHHQLRHIPQITRADLLETLEEAKNNRGNSESNHIHKSNSFIISSGKNKSFSCPLCFHEHYLFNCDAFRKLPVETRIEKAKTFKICLNCLRPGHHESRCKLSHCKYCKSKHNTLLHLDIHNKPVAHDSVVLSAEPSQSLINTNHVLLSTAMVKVLDGHGKSHAARVLLDNGSTGNFVTKEFCAKLNLLTNATNSRVTGINQQKTKWHRSYGELKEGMFVVIKEKTSAPLMWLLGRVVRVLPGRDGVARVADIQTKRGVIRRAYNTICPLPVKSFELGTSTRGVYGQAINSERDDVPGETRGRGASDNIAAAGCRPHTATH
ncbi:uncharacterized protein LOC131845200 isoform X1 [Achroia grisella]|uniref:uncharacterized protein LOC131845200 isoform X1 n=1 Tax=Achroia grisella TaxID=688607 RepID=UPI0027D21FDE|nr:uncharacterized protein LOC131845200 isoform X1 [Achroia grisella]